MKKPAAVMIHSRWFFADIRSKKEVDIKKKLAFFKASSY